MSHLTESQRYMISCMLKQHYNKSEIAIDKNKSVFHNEIKRNSDKRTGVYCDELANRKYPRRQK